MENRKKVLIVDDEQDVVEILSYNLNKANFEVFTAYNGNEAIDSALNNLPDLIIMDVRMPGMTGIEACRMMRGSETLKKTPILFLTADSDEYTSLNALEAGGSHFVTKPIRPSILLSMIKELFKS